MSDSLTAFRNASKLRWEQYTEFTPGKSVDGAVVADDTKAIPLEVWSERDTDVEVGSSTVLGSVGMVVSPARTLSEVHDAVRIWCRNQLGRNDVVVSDRS